MQRKMLNTSARLLRLLTLLETRREWSGAQLAERLEVSARTVRNDISRLRELGYPVAAAPGVAGGYRLGSGAAMPPLLLEDDEAVAVAVALRSTTAGGVAGIEETAVRALVKLEQVFPARLRRRVNALQAYTVAVATSGPTVDPHLLTVIAAACRDYEILRIDYTKYDGTETTRSIEPYRLVHMGRRWYLVAWDRDRNAWRTFRVDRMKARQSGPHYAPRELPAEDIASYVARSVRSAPAKYETRVIVNAPASIIAERVPRDIVIEPIDDSTCVVHARSNSVEMLALYLGMMDADFTVTDPPELVDRLGTLAARFEKASNGS
ncbi:MAG TPA: YafY family protein [Candidatus Sulfotelmatobacter sp.]|nr:YafY family protein [Candidatus Sulfotelmatobacter sp.]